ncbi:hypothetical protein RND81_07G114400 [Saponaria officinalis]|uniref:Uncharacterized protein n=1 Tax=Saponaria officinalis TaxID=3572 RepID=A0AAW1JQT6_SAPOF
MVVAELLRGDGTGWDSHKVRTLFEQERILNIRVSRAEVEDMWCWDLEKDGIYSVRSAYKTLVAQREDVASRSDFTKEKLLWSKIWRAMVWPRVKIFLLTIVSGLHCNKGYYC